MYTAAFSSKLRGLWGSQVRGLGSQSGTSGRVNLRVGPPAGSNSASASLQPRCAGGRSWLCRVKLRSTARWRHSCSRACRPGPLQIRVCGKRGGAETRPGRGEDGPAGQTDRGPGGRRAAQSSHVPPGSAGSRVRGFRHAPQVGPWAGDREGQGTQTARSLRAGRLRRILRRGRPNAAGVRSSECSPWRTQDHRAAALRRVHGGVSGPGRLCPHMGWKSEGKGRGAGGRGWQGRCPGIDRRLAAGRVGRGQGAATTAGREARSGCGRR